MNFQTAMIVSATTIKAKIVLARELG